MAAVIERCDNCHYWRRPARGWSPANANEGDCRKRAAVMYAIQPTGVWPQTPAAAWCGEWENKDWIITGPKP